ncbi:MAG: hypothetical protein ACRCTQ_06285 [Brevinemataceae bacterium]
MGKKNIFGNLMFVLHAHMPYVLGSEAEFWLFEAVLHSYLPFLNMLDRCDREKIPVRIFLNLSPILLLQLDTEYFKIKFKQYLQIRNELLSLDTGDESKNSILRRDLSELKRLEKYYYTFLNEDIISGFRKFKEKGMLEILTGTFSHPYLPLFVDFPQLMHLQISLGKKISEYHFGQVKGFWSPECGVFENLPELLRKNRITYFFADPGVIQSEYIKYGTGKIFGFDDVSYAVRDYDSTMKIWSSSNGFPSHPVYREFYSDLIDETPNAQSILNKSGFLKSGISLRAVTGNENKILYRYSDAFSQLNKDALNFSEYLFTNSYSESTFTTLLFDMELFGHWWKEGIDFLYLLFKKIGETAPDFLLNNFPKSQITMPPHLSTWGRNGNSESWLNQKTISLWQQIFSSSNKAENLISSFDTLNELEIISRFPDVISLFLAQASDWTFLTTYGSFSKLAEKMITGNIKNFCSQTTDSTINIFDIKKYLQNSKNTV